METTIPDQDRNGLRIYLRRCFEEGREPETLPDVGEGLRRLAETYQYTTVAQKFAYLLQLVAKRSRFPGDYVEFKFDTDAPALAASNSKEAEYLVWSLQEQSLLEGAIEATSMAGESL